VIWTGNLARIKPVENKYNFNSQEKEDNMGDKDSSWR